MGEYYTAPASRQYHRDPSRTTVDLYGNVWTGNRAELGDLPSNPFGSVTRIGMVVGGVRGNYDYINHKFTPDPINPSIPGHWLSPPFKYNTCKDLNGDGFLYTSSGKWDGQTCDAIAWNPPSSIDELILNYVYTKPNGVRAVAVDKNNNIWVGGSSRASSGNDFHQLIKVSGLGADPDIFLSTTNIWGDSNWNCAGGYGALVDGYGVLWSSRYMGGWYTPGGETFRYDTQAQTWPPAHLGLLDPYEYGMTVDPATGFIWKTTYGPEGCYCGYIYWPSGDIWGSFYQGSEYSKGIAIDSVGNVWIAHWDNGYGTTVGHLTRDGTWIADVVLNYQGDTGQGPTGVSIDSNGKVWAVCQFSDDAFLINPNGTVEARVDLGAGAGPYNYSDMTGFVAFSTTSPSGFWDFVIDTASDASGVLSLSWNGVSPIGTSIKVQVRASNSLFGSGGLTDVPFVTVSSGEPLAGRALGRYFEVRVTLAKNFGVASIPVLNDLTLNWQGNDWK
ncbi:MAG TPA: hypothetical protein VJA21_23365 [Verrucomicrobiae bacterium]